MRCLRSALPFTPFALLLPLLAAPLAARAEAPPAALPAGAAEAAKAIDAATLRAPIRFLADDLLEGRDPGSRGDELARLYLASELESLGLQPGAPGGSYQQPLDLVSIDSHAPDTWTFTAPGGKADLALKRSSEFIANAGRQAPEVKIADAEVVFVGYGIQAPEYGWDDFKGADLRGKVLLVLNNDPDWDPKLFEGKRRLYYGRWDYKYESAARQGAAGAIIIHTQPSAGYPWQVVQTSWSGPQFELPAGDEPRVDVAAWATEDAARRLVALAGRNVDELVKAAHDRSFRPVPLGIHTALTIPTTLAKTRSGNVLAVLPGSDPQLRDQYVVYTAHHDHLGVGDPDAAGDRIYNGARDNAAGVAQVLAIARAYTRLPQPPRRSVLFLFVAGEEQGLLGSLYWSRNPTVPPGKVAVDINFDGPGIWGKTKDLTFVGMGKSKDLDSAIVAAAGMQGREVRPDQFPDRGSFYRSDQFSFAKIGVPGLYLDNGTELVEHPGEEGTKLIEAWESTNYHQPSDQLTPEWRFDGMAQDAQAGFFAGLLLDGRDALPAWNPGDEFEAARKAALDAAAK